jgi:hypothetical protein
VFLKEHGGVMRTESSDLSKKSELFLLSKIFI